MKFLHSITALFLASSLVGCAAKAAPDKMLCDCLDKETTAYLAAHPGLKADEMGDAAAAIGAPCIEQVKSAYSEEAMRAFKGEERQRMNAAMEKCMADIESRLKEAAQ